MPADDVGLRTTIEAGLILTELSLRRRIQRVLVLAPASLRKRSPNRTEGRSLSCGHFLAKIMLEPLNPEFQPIELTTDDEDAVAVVAELVEVIGSAAPE